MKKWQEEKISFTIVMVIIFVIIRIAMKFCS